MIPQNKINKAFKKVIQSELKDASTEDVILIATAIWHEGFVPDIAWLESLSIEDQCIAGYITEFLAGFNVICKEEREHLLSVSKHFSSNAKNIAPNKNRDELATQWGVAHDLTPYFEHIAHLQTRHYKHTSEYKRPSRNFVL
ncbi:hypothetical protein [Marinibactrum halimedae]|uniref:Uncharacterized protein n=1 Tax=Marinibactrum halimedae TaxID=1444977 RepID=A0AA37T360_9GAMM|nr:hypothetical protein [Marinibactrum halimedae]MCD9461270.1 hypothetical protein [Marinibactrum halimedae]GLS25905.1 hypothetical protein GCM10007877_16190 [Marinibactrum halimedae]